MVKHLNKESFQDRVYDFEKDASNWNFKGDKPCIIDCYAEWWGPCKTLWPILDELSRDYEGKVDIYKIDTEQERDLSAAFGIRSIPSILFVPVDGQPQMVAGLLPKNELEKVIVEILKVEK